MMWLTRRRMVASFKVLCFLLFIGLVLGLIISPLLRSSKKHFTLNAVISSPALMQNLHKPNMIAPRYQGMTEAGNPYTLTAESAVQIDEDHLELYALHLELIQPSGKWIGAMGAKGIVTLSQKKVEMPGEVDLFTSDGYTAEMQDVVFYWQKGELESTQPVQANGPLGTLLANEIKAHREGQVIEFIGNVRLHLLPKTSQ